MRVFLLTLPLLLGSVATLAQDIAMEDWAIERVEAKYPIDGIKVVELHNPSGDIRVRPSDENEVATFRVTQHHKADPVQPSLTSKKDGERLIISLIYPPENPDDKALGKEKRRTDFSAFVPPDMTLIIRTTRGLAESKGHKGKLDIHSESGNINIKTKGNVDAFTSTGSIQAYHNAEHWHGSSSYKTDTGEIHLYILADPNIEAQVQTAGELSTDYSLEISHQPGGSMKKAVAKIGKPEHNLAVSSKNGKIALTRISAMISATGGSSAPPADLEDRK